MRAARLALRAPGLCQGPRVRALRHVRESLGAAAERDDEDDDGAQTDGAEGDVDRRAEALERLLAEVAEQPEDGRPHDPARGVPREEALPLHLRDARQERGVRAQDGDEAAEEDDFPAVPLEHIPRDLQVPLVDAELRAVANQEPVAARAADRVADVVADDRARGRRHDDALDRQVAGGAGVDRGDHEHRLARRGDAEALDRDDREDGEIAVVREQIVEDRCEYRRHDRLAWHALRRRCVLEQLPGVDLRSHVLRLGSVGRAVLEFDHRQHLLAAQPDHVLAAAARIRRLLHDLVLDALIIERLLDLPAVVQVVVDEGERAAVELHFGHERTLPEPRAVRDQQWPLPQESQPSLVSLKFVSSTLPPLSGMYGPECPRCSTRELSFEGLPSMSTRTDSPGLSTVPSGNA